jgi:beta-glucosidase
MSFKNGFVWGAATASYQIEGAWNEDSKGLSVWDQMCRWPGRVYRGQTGNIACDHYHRLEEDLDLMAAVGLKAYRFSFSWPRILPDGTGAVNEAGLAFYDRLIDGLLARNITPWATLFHWDYPLALYHRGGWMHPDSPQWFADYATVLAARYGNRVRHWMTLNEPQIFIGLGHYLGIHAPGLKLPETDIALMIHRVLTAHGRAVQALRSHCTGPVSIGWAPAVGVASVALGFEGDAEVVAAARQAQFDALTDGNIARGASVWCDPVFLGRYPEAFVEKFGAALPAGWEADLPEIAAPIDFCGMNIYIARERWSRDASGGLRCTHEDDFGDGFPRTCFGWPVVPEALYWGPRFFHERYRRPIFITENGMSSHDWVALDGRVHDPARIDFTARYLREFRRAAQDGVEAGGYFHWSLMDNFEWAEGYKHRFGLIHVDYATQKRTLKDSAHWYRTVIESNGAAL